MNGKLQQEKLKLKTKKINLLQIEPIVLFDNS